MGGGAPQLGPRRPRPEAAQTPIRRRAGRQSAVCPDYRGSQGTRGVSRQERAGGCTQQSGAIHSHSASRGTDQNDTVPAVGSIYVKSAKHPQNLQ